MAGFRYAEIGQRGIASSFGLLFTMLLVSSILILSTLTESKHLAKEDCIKLQECLDIADSYCWNVFYEAGNKEGNLHGLLTDECVSKKTFAQLLQQAERDHSNRMLGIDDALTVCMEENGYKKWFDYCPNFRPRKVINNNDIKCWDDQQNLCMDKYQKGFMAADSEMAEDLEKCFRENQEMEDPSDPIAMKTVKLETEEEAGLKGIRDELHRLIFDYADDEARKGVCERVKEKRRKK